MSLFSSRSRCITFPCGSGFLTGSFLVVLKLGSTMASIFSQETRKTVFLIQLKFSSCLVHQSLKRCLCVIIWTFWSSYEFYRSSSLPYWVSKVWVNLTISFLFFCVSIRQTQFVRSLDPLIKGTRVHFPKDTPTWSRSVLCRLFWFRFPNRHRRLRCITILILFSPL